MESKSGFEGIYRSVDSPKRRQQVEDRLLAGQDLKRIAKDLGLERSTVQQIVDRLRDEGGGPGEKPSA
jgi:DNA-binding MarR family transcriptional regulator